MAKVGDRVRYMRLDYPGGTTLTAVLSATIVKIGKKKIKIRLDKPYTPIKKGFTHGKPITETWVEPHNIGLPMRKDYRKNASGCLTLIVVGLTMLIGCLTLLTIVI